MQTPQNNPKPPNPSDLFAANKAINAQSMVPATGYASVPTYQPSGKIGALAFPLLALSLLVVPAFCAALYLKLGHFGGYVLFSELALGLLVGALMFPAVQWGKIRNPKLAGGAGAILAALTFLGAMGLEAWQARPAYIASETAYLSQKYRLSPPKARAVAEQFYSPLNTIKFYWLDYAQSGMTMSDSSSSGRTASTTRVSGAAFWGLQGLSLFFAACLGGLVAAQWGQRRFSEEFDCWFKVKKFGGVHPLHVETVVEAAQAGDFARVAQFATVKDQRQSAAQVTAAYLPQKAGAIVSIKAGTGNKKGLQAIFEQPVTNEQMKALWPAFPVTNAQNSPFSS